MFINDDTPIDASVENKPAPGVIPRGHVSPRMSGRDPEVRGHRGERKRKSTSMENVISKISRRSTPVTSNHHSGRQSLKGQL